MHCHWTVPAEITATDADPVRWIDDTPVWFPRGENLAAPESGAAGPTGPGDEDDDDESGGGVGNIDPEVDEGYDGDEEEDDDEEDTLWAAPA